MASLLPLLSAVAEGILVALDKIRQSYEEDTDFHNNLVFHNTTHTQEVINVSEYLMRQVQHKNRSLVSDRDILLAKLAAGFHDIVQDWERSDTVEGSRTKSTRIRYIPGKIENERKSADEAELFMRLYNINHDVQIFSEEDIALVREGVEATFAYFDPQMKTFIRPNINNASSLLARVVAFADLNKSGLDPQGSLVDGDKYFREINLDIEEAVRSGDSLPDDLKEYFKERILMWIEDQVPFIEGRVKLLESELAGAPEELVQVIRETFSQYDAALELAKEVAMRRRRTPADKLLVELGYLN